MVEATDLVVRLGRIEHLFDAPDTAPFEGRFEVRSGMDQIVYAVGKQLRTALVRPFHVALLVEGNERAEDEVLAAIRGHCEATIAGLRRELSATSRAGLDALVKGLAFLAACMLLSTLVGNLALPGDFLRRLFSEGLVIAGWVALWRPIELLLYDTWPLRRQIRVYRAILKADLRIVDGRGAA